MAGSASPWWLGFALDNPVRRALHRPEAMLAPYLERGMTVLDVGCGMGVLSLPLARLVGPQGLVVAVDLQQRALHVLLGRARRAGLADRIRTHRCEADDLGVAAAADLIVAFWMVHEVRSAARFLAQARTRLAPGGRMLLAEPILHVSAARFEREIAAARGAGLSLLARPRIRLSRAALLGAGPTAPPAGGGPRPD